MAGLAPAPEGRTTPVTHAAPNSMADKTIKYNLDEGLDDDLNIVRDVRTHEYGKRITMANPVALVLVVAVALTTGLAIFLSLDKRFDAAASSPKGSFVSQGKPTAFPSPAIAPGKPPSPPLPHPPPPPPAPPALPISGPGDQHSSPIELSSSQCGSWPRVMILGVQKGATTSLMAAFSLADGVGKSGASGCCDSHYCVKSPRKAQGVGESHYLLDCSMHGEEQPCSEYPLIYAKANSVNVDSTPSALSCPKVPGHLHTVMPSLERGSLRLIMVFREQSSRLLSIYNHRHVDQMENGKPHYYHCGEQGLKHGTYEPSFHAFSSCLVRKWRSNDDGVRDWYSQTSKHCASPPELARGMYTQALAKWCGAWPREQIFVIGFHQLVSHDGGSIMDGVASFTGVPTLPRSLPHANTHSSSWKVDAMCCATRCELLALHAAENLKLYRQLAADQSAQTHGAPKQEPPFSPFPSPRCVECHNISTDCVPVASPPLTPPIPPTPPPPPPASPLPIPPTPGPPSRQHPPPRASQASPSPLTSPPPPWPLLPLALVEAVATVHASCGSECAQSVVQSPGQQLVKAAVALSVGVGLLLCAVCWRSRRQAAAVSGADYEARLVRWRLTRHQSTRPAARTSATSWPGWTQLASEGKILVDPAPRLMPL
mmetsp:Transcript_63485/g.141573  ORF Transcript_63485/g.141573 Transcript_63485/m.141573 type:complete len:655 (-) Transcript_63485:256-2220(-)